MSKIAPTVRINAPNMVIGTNITIHHDTTIYGEGKLVIGHNVWIGEHSVINCTSGLWIGNNVGIGIGSHIYTHANPGALFDGCLLENFAPVVIEDDAWLCGGLITINPGIVIGHNSMILPGAVVTKNTEPYKTYAGVPAKEITIKAYQPKEWTIGEKDEYLKGLGVDLSLYNTDKMTVHAAEGKVIKTPDGRVVARFVPAQNSHLEMEYKQQLMKVIANE